MKFDLVWCSLVISCNVAYSLTQSLPSWKNRAPRVSPFVAKRRIVIAASQESQRGERKGFYVRPSAAIEKGGGFFIPGLEGEWRLRVLCSSLVTVLLAANRFPGYEVPQSQIISEGVGAAAAILLVVQALSKSLELNLPQNFEALAPTTKTSKVSFVSQKYSKGENENLNWAANAMLDLVTCRGAILVRDGQVECMSGYYETSHPWSSSPPILPEGWMYNSMENGMIEKSNDPIIFDYMPVGCNYLATHLVRSAESGDIDTKLVWLFPLDVAWVNEARQRAWIERIGRFAALK